MEFPAQGYVNPLTTTMSFDVSMVVPNPGSIAFPITAPLQGVTVRFQNNIQSIFSRVRLLYGANPLEDIINYNVIVRNLTEWTAGNPSFTIDQGTITDGIGNNTLGFVANGGVGLLNTRANVIQGCAFAVDPSTSLETASAGRGLTGVSDAPPAGVLSTPSIAWYDTASATLVNVPTIIVTRRYQVQLALGLLTQEYYFIFLPLGKKSP